ncbi:MAG: imidazole glycerol phosphate synthase subunit HisH [Bacteroidetes bacterium]|nr:imidazole glycerol phosphate synthase subunit HisH [Bacteroidota bacterium]MBS1748058.1 imidazole glycerol phosphate synthase subunit HisH [Bacteroidota bacterium]
MGNIHSVARKLYQMNIEPVVSSSALEIAQADKIILPGVGHFGQAMQHLHDLNLVSVLNEVVLEKKTPILGICLGMQLMTQKSEEGAQNGFGWIEAEVRRFQIRDQMRYKVPHVGWNTVEHMKASSLLKGIDNQSEFYFVHSYYCDNHEPATILHLTEYEQNFCSAFEKNNIYGVQYHPEKSHSQGALLIKNFIDL